jgi:hypothetical protein
MSERKLPNLDHMRCELRIGMTRDEFFQVCDDLTDDFTLRVGSPILDHEKLVSIHVEEGDTLLCFLHEGRLSYVEYRGGVFLDREESSAT